MTAGAGSWRPAALLGLAALWLLVLCAPALAHAELEGAFPAEGDTLSEQPEEVRLRFDQPVRAEFDPIQVFDESGDRVDEDDGRADPDDQDIVVVSLKDLPTGRYTVEWHVTSADGDPIGEKYGFAVANSAIDAEGGGEETDQTEESSGVPLGAVLGVLLVSVLMVGGFVVVRRRRGL